MPAYTPPALVPRRPSARLGLELALLDDAPQPRSARPTELQTVRPHVLVADDDADLRQYVRQCLQELCWITEAANGADALAKALRVRPALVVTDAVMPLASGSGLCRALRADPDLRATPILAISGEADALPGADAFLRKPFSRQELLHAVRALLAAR